VQDAGPPRGLVASNSSALWRRRTGGPFLGQAELPHDRLDALALDHQRLHPRVPLAGARHDGFGFRAGGGRIGGDLRKVRSRWPRGGAGGLNSRRSSASPSISLVLYPPRPLFTGAGSGQQRRPGLRPQFHRPPSGDPKRIRSAVVHSSRADHWAPWSAPRPYRRAGCAIQRRGWASPRVAARDPRSAMFHVKHCRYGWWVAPA